jgi:hypothetical protein
MTNYTADQLATFPWIVSTDTLKPEHLLVAFWQVAEQLGADLTSIRPSLEALVGEDSKESDWNDDDASGALEELGDALQDVAPTGFYFGADEGDGACFGFWVTEDWAEHLEQMDMGNDDPTGWASLIQELELGGVDTDNFEDCYQGRAEGYSEERAGADYAQELAEETGAIDWNKLQWPLTCIDWEQAWQELRMGDGYWLQDIGGGDWLVFRSV